MNGIVTSQFYHHIIGMLMFLVDFGGSIGERLLCVSDMKLTVERSFGYTQWVFFSSAHGTSRDGAGPSESPTEESNDELDWVGDYIDFFYDEVANETSNGKDDSLFTEHPCTSWAYTILVRTFWIGVLNKYS